MAELQNEFLPAEGGLITDRIPTKEELKTLMNDVGLRDRLSITLATSSGLRVRTICTLTFGDVKLNEEIPRIIVERRPGRKIRRKLRRHATFLTPHSQANADSI